MALSGGILIVGSLLWDERRKAWRESRLDMNSSQLVTAPIRYGRQAASRGKTYTMVFSNGCQAGQAKVVPYAHSVDSAADLITGAEHLWGAERNAAPGECLSAAWGCVALLCNPDKPMAEQVLNGWRTRLSKERNYGNLPQPDGEGCLVSTDGILQIGWPKYAGDQSAVAIDFLLATATSPTLAEGKYPTSEAIANVWNEDTGHHVQYFWKNRDNNIWTFEDDEIIKRLRSRRPH